MPKKPVKKSAAKKAAPAKKAPAENFMARMLKKKEAALKQAQADGKVGNGDHAFHTNPRHQSFARFAGPRRRTAG